MMLSDKFLYIRKPHNIENKKKMYICCVYNFISYINPHFPKNFLFYKLNNYFCKLE